MLHSELRFAGFQKDKRSGTWPRFGLASMKWRLLDRWGGGVGAGGGATSLLSSGLSSLQPGGAELSSDITWVSIISANVGRRQIGKSGELPTSGTITRGSFKALTNRQIHLHAHKHSRIRCHHLQIFNFVAWTDNENKYPQILIWPVVEY